MSKKNSKRILSVTVKRMVDECPDTSWLGEYSQRAKTDYAIDRAHAEDCASLAENHSATVEKLERVIFHLNAWRTEEGNKPESTEWEPLDESIDALVALQDEAMECDCNGGDMCRNELQYFNGPVENYKGDSPENIRKYIRQDYERMEKLNRGDWCFLGIRVEAQVILRTNADGSGIVQDITSGGLWGIESDSESSYLESVATDEWAELKEELGSLGFSKRALAMAWKERKEKDA